MCPSWPVFMVAFSEKSADVHSSLSLFSLMVKELGMRARGPGFESQHRERVRVPIDSILCKGTTPKKKIVRREVAALTCGDAGSGYDWESISISPSHCLLLPPVLFQPLTITFGSSVWHHSAESIGLRET